MTTYILLFENRVNIVRSDRGGQFRSDDYPRLLAGNALMCSMSAEGYCGDNAACEGFFRMLKRERVHHKTYSTLESTRANV
jgi:putative transposase